MPERTGLTPPPEPVAVASDDQLEQSLVRVVLSVPGVVGIEPDLGDLLRLAGRGVRNLTGRPPQTGDASYRAGLSLSLHGGQVDVEVDIAVAGPPALHTAYAVRRVISEALTEQGQQSGRITVTVLRIEDLPDGHADHGQA